ncbi:xylulose kinase [Streptomyces alboflavus]|uniref:Xylulose kinase n=1 Tax=Streptomyces alboflavus TaxID=67267 RepID=A0A1Z1WQH3_9ACTN|nr:xylulose kinase [Streptomyces alboflavus]
MRGSDELPFSKGTLVAPGTGDNAAAALGLGLRPGTPVLSLGTSGTVYAVSERRPTDPTGTVAGFADARGAWLPLACTLNCTQAIDRVAALLSLDREAVQPGGAVTVLPTWTASARPTCRTPRGHCTACATTRRRDRCSRRRTTARSTLSWERWTPYWTRRPTAPSRCC